MKINKTEHNCAHKEGVLFEIYYAGCEHECPGCYAKELWDPNNGREMSVSELVDLVAENAIDGVCLLGGDPLYQAEETNQLIASLKHSFKFPVIMYTGYTREEIEKDADKEGAFQMCDKVITGRYVESKRTKGRIGSTNQRVWLNKNEF